MNFNNKNHKPEVLAATCLLLSIGKSDEVLETSEIDSIKEIICDFFNVINDDVDEIINIGKKSLEKSTDLFEYSKILNNIFTYQDKVDFICCAFEVAFSDGDLHYLEEHFIKKIATILNVEHHDLINSKIEIKKYLI